VLSRLFGHLDLTHTTGDSVRSLVVSFLTAVKCRLRGTDDHEPLVRTLSIGAFERVQATNNHPAAILCFLSRFFLDRVERDKKIVINQWVLAENELTLMQQACTDCERIIMTPVPLPYVTTIRQLLWVYLVTLPFVLQGNYASWTVTIATVIVAGTFFAIEAAAHVIENPFGMHWTKATFFPSALGEQYLNASKRPMTASAFLLVTCSHQSHPVHVCC
jgi:predicted membrane chloride channel (bestrophin family)